MAGEAGLSKRVPGEGRGPDRDASTGPRPSPGNVALAFPRLPDRVAQRLVADGALEDLVADDEGRGAGGLEVAGELEVAAQLADRRRRPARSPLRPTAARALASASAVGWPAANRRSWKGLKRPGLGGGEAGPGGGLAVGAEHRPFAPDHLQLRILAEQPVDVGIALAAIAAGIIEEFDEDDVAVGGARPGAGERGSSAVRLAETIFAASRARSTSIASGRTSGFSSR